MNEKQSLLYRALCTTGREDEAKAYKRSVSNTHGKRYKHGRTVRTR